MHTWVCARVTRTFPSADTSAVTSSHMPATPAGDIIALPKLCKLCLLYKNVFWPFLNAPSAAWLTTTTTTTTDDSGSCQSHFKTSKACLLHQLRQGLQKCATCASSGARPENWQRLLRCCQFLLVLKEPLGGFCFCLF